MPNSTFAQWYFQLSAKLKSQNHRNFVIFCGDMTWATKQVDSLISNITESSIDIENGLVFSDISGVDAQVNKTNFRQFLGMETRYIFYVANEVNLDVLAALSGTIVGGGTLFLWWPDRVSTNDKRPFNDRIFRIAQQCSSNEHNYIINQEGSGFTTKALVFDQEARNKAIFTDTFCVTNEQRAAVEGVKKVVTGHRNRPMVLTADRGRGKSSALAIATAELLIQSQQKMTIIVTAPQRQSLNIFFEQLRHCLPNAKCTTSHLMWEQHTVEFLPIDVLLKTKIQVNLMIVDEAASLPIYLLEQILPIYHRLVFSTTVHGYEGAGRGFTIKFQKVLAKVFPEWKSLHIREPVRWSTNDPLENFIFQSCLLNAELPKLSTDKIGGVTSYDFSLVTGQELSENEGLLSDIFSILVTAHYQTKPSDLEMLLTNPEVRLCYLHSNKQVIAVALILAEGGVKSIDVNAVKESQRRLKNHFLPQSLTVHCGQEDAFEYRYCRVVRIAVHPEIQNNGIGSYLLNKVEFYAQKEDFDFIGTCFAANRIVANFWLKSGYQTARIGFNKDASSGEHSALMLKSLSERNHKTLTQLSEEFYRTFSYYLTDEYKLLEVKLVDLILANCPKSLLKRLNDKDRYLIHQFANGYMQYSSIVYSLHLWLLSTFTDEPIIEFNRLLFIERVLMKKSVEEICQLYNLTGKKALIKELQKQIHIVLNR